MANFRNFSKIYARDLETKIEKKSVKIYFFSGTCAINIIYIIIIIISQPLPRKNFFRTFFKKKNNNNDALLSNRRLSFS